MVFRVTNKNLLPTYEDYENVNKANIKMVSVYIEFVRIGEIDTMNERYQAEIRIESKWTLSEQITSYDPKVNWNPQLFIENAFQEPKESTNYSCCKDITGGTLVTETKTVKGIIYSFCIRFRK